MYEPEPDCYKCGELVSTCDCPPAYVRPEE
jgi:hypothetical protein